jgi:hypothetical protein
MAGCLILIRGLPGSGKSTLADKMNPFAVYAADDYFYDRYGVYRFDPKKLPDAHAHCQRRTNEALKTIQRRASAPAWEGPSGSLVPERHEHDMEDTVIVNNTFSQRWEMEPYFKMVDKYQARLWVIDLFDSGLTDAQLAKWNTHQVPEHAIRSMRRRWEHHWAGGNPTPPWER